MRCTYEAVLLKMWQSMKHIFIGCRISGETLKMTVKM